MVSTKKKIKPKRVKSNGLFQYIAALTLITTTMKTANLVQLIIFIISCIGTFLFIQATLNDDLEHFKIYFGLALLSIIPWIYSLVKAIKTKDTLGILLVLLISTVGVPYVLIKRSNN